VARQIARKDDRGRWQLPLRAVVTGLQHSQQVHGRIEVPWQLTLSSMHTHLQSAGLALGVLLAWICRTQRRRWRRRKLAKYGHSLCSIHITEADEFGGLFSKSQLGPKQAAADHDKISARQGKSIQLPAFSIHANATGRGGISALPAAAADSRQSLDGGALGAAHALHRSIVRTKGACGMHCCIYLIAIQQLGRSRTHLKVHTTDNSRHLMCRCAHPCAAH
jgi:hypothetical protein